ncbi:MAG TPA: hypothetical protein VK664_22955, partial [Flavitalea sp.]|nr:hypothetical protein [Flavitalea sp.]
IDPENELEQEYVTSGLPHQTSEYNAHAQPDISGDDIPGDIEDEVEEEDDDQNETDPGLKPGNEEGRDPGLEAGEEKKEEAQEEIDDSRHHSKSDQPVILDQPVIAALAPASTDIAPVNPKELFYDDGEVFAEFITEETNEELRLNEETLNAPWETEEEDAGENSSGEDEPVSDEELRNNFEKRKHLTSEVVAGDRERLEPLNRGTDQANVEQPARQFEYSDDQMVDRPDLISFEAQKASQRDPLPEEIENITEHETVTDEVQTVTDEFQNAVQSQVSAENAGSNKDAGSLSAEAADPLVAKNPEPAFAKNPEPEVAKDAPVDVQKLEFDPYYTIDYFASQGIKLKLEDFSKDKLGQQLKSFTEWIRSMKRLPQQVAENSMDETAQHSIRRIAEHSVEEKEVLTESMAEVWVKQGNYEKARQIYRKLSLQNPSKSTYFAAKIDQLKVL